MKLITESLLDEVSQQAIESPRLRMNYNMHDSLEDGVQRMLNALEPGTYLPPHRHAHPAKVETYIVLRGRLIAFFFTEQGEVEQFVELSPSYGQYGVEIPAGVWHTLVTMEKGTVIFEVKEGPYVPLSKEDLAPWAPSPTEVYAVDAYVKHLVAQVK